MAPRYVPIRAWQPVGEWLADPDRSRLSVDVVIRDDAPRDTGLVDASGTRLYAVEERDPIGFVRFA